MIGPSKHLVFIQFGDFQEAWERLAAGGAETYQAQKASMEHVIDRVGDYAVTIINFGRFERSDTMLDCGVRVIRPGPDAFQAGKAFWLDLLTPLGPTHAVLRTPCLPALAALTKLRCDTLVTLADSFNGKGVRARLYQWRLAQGLNAPTVRIAANHGRIATRQLGAIGVKPEKVIAWDWPPSYRPHDYDPKPAPAGDRPPEILFVGMLIPAKGVDDLIAATRRLVDGRLAPIVRIVGKGDQERLRSMIDRVGLGDHVVLEGVRPNREVFAMMRDADIVVVPSRHDYPEGMPLTIYEALASRTPLLISDHPMFVENIRDGQDGMTFPAGNEKQLAEAARRLLTDGYLYERLSRNTLPAWERLQLPVTWMELLDRWLDDSEQNRAWLARHSLACQGDN